MADPLTIIGTVGALCNIIDVVSKTIKTTNTWRMRRKDSDLYLRSLASQLISLRAALNKIQEWMDAEEDEAHYQLEMDLDMAISCCKVLVDRLEMAFRPFKKSVPGSWDVLAKLKMILGTTGLDELQKLLEQQTSALNLLLTACNCKATSAQMRLLQIPTTREILERTKADTASLVVHRDNTSRISRWTDNLSKISVAFEFDREVFSSRVYEQKFRSALKDELRDSARRSITDQLSGEIVTFRRLMPRMQAVVADPDTISVETRPIQGRLVVKDMAFEKQTTIFRNVQFRGESVAEIALVLSFLQSSYETQPPSERTLASSPDCRMVFHSGGCEYRLYDSSHSWTAEDCAAAKPDTVPIIIFGVDLSRYDTPMPINTWTKLTRSLLQFRYLASLSSYENCPLLLMLTGNNHLASKLHNSPFQQYFLDFGGGTDALEATNYITKRFLDPSSIRNPGRVTTCYIDNPDAEQIVKSFFKGIIAPPNM